MALEKFVSQQGFSLFTNYTVFRYMVKIIFFFSFFFSLSELYNVRNRTPKSRFESDTVRISEDVEKLKQNRVAFTSR